MLLSIFLFAIAIAYLCLSIHLYENAVKKDYWHFSIGRDYSTLKKSREVIFMEEWKDAVDCVRDGAVILGITCYIFYIYAYETFGFGTERFWMCIAFEVAAALTYFIVARRKILLWEKWTLAIRVILCILLPIIAGICIQKLARGNMFV